MTAYQITSMMEGVVQRGTATVVREVGKPIAGKTGTTNDEKDAWFIGFSPDIVCRRLMGYDKPRHIGRRATGGQSGGADREGFPEGGARRQAADAVPRAAGHQAHPRRRQDRHARRPGRSARRSSKRSSPALRRPTATRSSATEASSSGGADVGLAGTADRRGPHRHRRPVLRLRHEAHLDGCRRTPIATSGCVNH